MKNIITTFNDVLALIALFGCDSGSDSAGGACANPLPTSFYLYPVTVGTFYGETAPTFGPAVAK